MCNNADYRSHASILSKRILPNNYSHCNLTISFILANTAQKIANSTIAFLNLKPEKQRRIPENWFSIVAYEQGGKIVSGAVGAPA